MKTFNQKLAITQTVVATVLAVIFTLFMMLSFYDLTREVAPLTSTVGVVIYSLMAILFGHTASEGYDEFNRTIKQ